LYLPPMEKVEANGLTFYVFEAQGRSHLDLATVDHFNLPDEMQARRRISSGRWGTESISLFPGSAEEECSGDPGGVCRARAGSEQTRHFLEVAAASLLALKQGRGLRGEGHCAWRRDDGDALG